MTIQFEILLIINIAKFNYKIYYDQLNKFEIYKFIHN